MNGLKLFFSSFNNQDDSPLLDSYPKNPSPESNISTRLWTGGDRNANQRKIFIYKSGQLGSTNYSLSTNLYEDYNFDGAGITLNNYFNKSEDESWYFLRVASQLIPLEPDHDLSRFTDR